MDNHNFEMASTRREITEQQKLKRLCPLTIKIARPLSIIIIIMDLTDDEDRFKNKANNVYMCVTYERIAI